MFQATGQFKILSELQTYDQNKQQSTVTVWYTHNQDSGMHKNSPLAVMPPVIPQTWLCCRHFTLLKTKNLIRTSKLWTKQSTICGRSMKHVQSRLRDTRERTFSHHVTRNQSNLTTQLKLHMAEQHKISSDLQSYDHKNQQSTTVVWYMYLRGSRMPDNSPFLTVSTVVPQTWLFSRCFKWQKNSKSRQNFNLMAKTINNPQQ